MSHLSWEVSTCQIGLDRTHHVTEIIQILDWYHYYIGNKSKKVSSSSSFPPVSDKVQVRWLDSNFLNFTQSRNLIFPEYDRQDSNFKHWTLSQGLYKDYKIDTIVKCKIDMWYLVRTFLFNYIYFCMNLMHSSSINPKISLPRPVNTLFSPFFWNLINIF